MKYICKSYKVFNESVYLFKTMFNSYDFIVNKESKNGEFIVRIEDSILKIPVQLYGEDEEMEFIFREPSELANMDDNDILFEQIITDVLYILNKNNLSFKFNIKTIEKEYGMDFHHAIIKVNKKCSIEDLERLVTTTKIMSKKVKDIGDIDKLIYLTKTLF